MEASKGTSRRMNKPQHKMPSEQTSTDSEANSSTGERSDVDMKDSAAQEEDESDNESEPEKSMTELELEKLVFGDHRGFRDDLEHFELSGSDEDFEDEDDEFSPSFRPRDLTEDQALTQDSDLFISDLAPSKIVRDTAAEDDDTTEPAWIDSDDDRHVVSLMSAPKLRKLRTFEGEDVISGREYSSRLRRQFEALHPTPEWAKRGARNNHPRKRRRSNNLDNGSEASSDEDGSSGDEQNEDEDIPSTKPLTALLQSTAPLTRSGASGSNSKRLKLNPEVLPIVRMRDIGPTQPHSIDTLAIHPHLPLILSAGNSSNMYLHHLKPQPTPPDAPNPLITSMHLKGAPLTTAAFSPEDTTQDSLHMQHPKIYLSSRRRYFHTWTLPTGQIRKTARLAGEQRTTQRSFEVLKPSPCGRYLALKGTARKQTGVVNVLSAATHQLICQARVDARKGLADFCWWGDGRGMTLVAKHGEVTEYSVEAARAVWRWQDEGGHGATVVALGGAIPAAVLHKGRNKRQQAQGALLGPDQWIAIGSQAGVVTVYDRAKFIEQAAAFARADDSLVTSPAQTPLRSLDNLTTPISNLCFSKDGQLLVASSRWKRDALRLIHLPTCAVYKNWPTSKTPLGRISSVALGQVQVENGSEEEMRIVLLVGNENGSLRGWLIGASSL